MTSTRLDMKTIIFEPSERVTTIHFPTKGVISLVTILKSGAGVEMATVGREGMVGVSVFLGDFQASNLRAIVQVGGSSLRMDARDFQEESRKAGPFRDMLQAYTQALLTQAAQEIACNRMHATEERCARWLLTTRDRVDGDEFPITQEFLAEMLGVRRASVTVAAGALQRAGFIRYMRGSVEVLDRMGLEGASCECYGVIRTEYERLLPSPF